MLFQKDCSLFVLIKQIVLKNLTKIPLTGHFIFSYTQNVILEHILKLTFFE